MSASFCKIASFARSTIHKKLARAATMPDVQGPRDQALEGGAAAGRALPKKKIGFPALLENPLKIGLLGPT
jgi:hypothetical protein